jgi:transketolase
MIHWLKQQISDINYMKHTLKELKKIANQLRQDVIEMVAIAGSGHQGGPLGMADIFAALYFEVLNHDPRNPDWPERDILILSNGHTTPIRYAAMARSGYFEPAELKTLRQFGSRLQGHPERDKLPGLETTSGPLGSGLSQAAGMAMSLKIDGIKSRYVYCVMSDGEQNEGNTWEAAMFAAKYDLPNLIAITDRNNIQIDGNTESIMPLDDLSKKWRAFGWEVIDIDGNDLVQIVDACQKAKATTKKPVMIMASTVPGKGVDFMENDYHWHSKVFAEGEAEAALRQLRVIDQKIEEQVVYE